MRKTWMTAPVAVLVALVVAWWYLDCPRDLRLDNVTVGPISTFSEVSIYPSDVPIMQIAFTSRSDLRATMLREFWAVTEPELLPCNCRKEGFGQTLCEKSLTTAIFDSRGYINSYNDTIQTSASVPNITPIRYHLLLPLTQQDKREPLYDLNHHTTDLCFRLVRYTLFIPLRKSNIVRISKGQLSAAIAQPVKLPPLPEPDRKDPNLVFGDLLGQF